MKTEEMTEGQPISRRKFLQISSRAAAGLIACGVSAGLGVYGCSPAPAPTNTPEPTKTTQPTQTPEPTQARPRTWPLGDVPRNRTLNYSFMVGPATGQFNPFSQAYSHQNGNALLYEPCAYYSIQADRTYLWLAESYQYNADGTELVITFRKGIKWSDGAPFTVDDVVWSMTTLKNNPDLNRSWNYVTELDKVEKINDLTVKVTLNQSDWRFFFKSLTFCLDYGDCVAIQPMHIYKDAAEANAGIDLPTFNVYDMARGWPISTGPYGVWRLNRKDHSLRPAPHLVGRGHGFRSQLSGCLAFRSHLFQMGWSQIGPNADQQ
jgi:ABC-type transport system substrate-binding protein